jgi:hypothetical protein
VNLSRPTAVIAGVFFLLTEVGTIAGAVLYSPILKGADHITGTGADDRILLGALFELLLVIVAVGTAVTLYPILKRQKEGSRSRSSWLACWRRRPFWSRSSAS